MIRNAFDILGALDVNKRNVVERKRKLDGKNIVMALLFLDVRLKYCVKT